VTQYIDSGSKIEEGHFMRTFIWVLIGLSALGFVLAVISALLNIPLWGVSAEGLSRACTNLALIAIAVHLVVKEKGDNT
jgi:hypothetical protein